MSIREIIEKKLLGNSNDNDYFEIDWKATLRKDIIELEEKIKYYKKILRNDKYGGRQPIQKRRARRRKFR